MAANVGWRPYPKRGELAEVNGSVLDFPYKLWGDRLLPEIRLCHSRIKTIESAIDMEACFGGIFAILFRNLELSVGDR